MASGMQPSQMSVVVPPGVTGGSSLQVSTPSGPMSVVVPGGASYADGLRKINRGPTGRYTGAKAPLVVQPRSTTYWDLILVDGGSGRCEKLLRPPGVSERDARKLKSLTCSFANEIY